MRGAVDGYSRPLESRDMIEPPPGSPPVLNYRSPGSEKELPSPATAMLLCLPWILCWSTVLLIKLISYRTPSGWEFILILVIWGIAVITAISSVLIYARRRKPWYVWLNLIVNIVGLLSTAAVVGIVGYIVLTFHMDS